MKKTVMIVLAALLLLSLCGCGSMFSSEYYYSEPFPADTGEGDGSETEIRSSATLRRAILELVYAGETQGQFRFGSYNGSLLDDLAAVCLEIKTSTPIGAYAVEDISYDTSRIVSYYTADISIRYKKSASEIASVVELSGLGELGSHILGRLEAYSQSTVVSIYSSAASEEYIKNFVRESYYADPFLVAEEPAVSVAAFPETGPDRIYVIYFRYDMTAEQLAKQEEQLQALANSWAEGPEGESPLAAALRLAVRLAENCAGNEGSSLRPETAYAALAEGSGDSFAMAMAYKALCDRAGINCMVVRGESRTGEGSAHAWNIIELDGEYYHVDTSHFQTDAASAFLLSDDDIWGEYNWDRGEYPPCGGSLGPEDVFELPQDQTEDSPPDPEEPGPPESGEDTPTPPPVESPIPGDPESPETAE